MEAVSKRELPARPLKVLVPLIKEELDAIEGAGIEHKRKVGEMLIEAKAQVEHGEWGPWLERNFHLSQHTASEYMRLAVKSREREIGGHPPFSSLQQAIGRPARSPAPKWAKPVRKVVSRVNMEALAQDRQNREKEASMIRQLALRLIDIGYKVLAAELHPDKPGGSREAMARLNEVRDILKRAI